MPCNLNILGKNLDIDALIADSKLRGFSKHYKGQPMNKNRPGGKTQLHSRVSIETSKADFDNLEQQIKESIRYLKRNGDKLKIIKQTKGIDLAVLDFGINLRIDRAQIFIQSERFPAELLKLAGDIGLDIELSIYPVDFGELAENISKNRFKK